MSFIASILLISIAIILLLPIGMVWRILLETAIVIYGLNLMRGHLSLIRLKYMGSGKWLLQTSKRVVEGEILGDSTVTSLVSVLRFRLYGQYLTRSCVLFRDSLLPDQYRQLMIILRMY